MSFKEFGLSPEIMSGVEAHGYTIPTPIQKQAIPAVLEGRDVMGLAQTGTGKTAAFLLPIMDRLLSGHRHHIRALIIAPTRELAEQINDEALMLGKGTDLRTVTIYGGVGFGPQLDKLQSGVEIVIACPGRLLDHMNQGNIRLAHVETLVLDEADRMLDMGFLPDIKKILKHVPKKRQTLMFSATMPDDIRGLAHEVLHDPVTVQIAFASPVKSVTHTVFPVPAYLKTSLLRHVLKAEEMGSVLIFTKTKHKATRLHEQLKRSGYTATLLQGDMSQKKRQAALDGFRDGKYQILVATDIAARGIDVLTISHVINYDMPDTVDSYTHRIGRTGRAERTGSAYTFVTNEETDLLRSFERVIDVELVLREFEDFDYNAPAPPKDFTRSARPPRSAGGPKHPRRKPRPVVEVEKPAPAPVITEDSEASAESKAKRKRKRRRKKKDTTGAGQAHAQETKQPEASGG